MNTREYKAEFSEFFNVLLTLDKEWLDIYNNIYLQLRTIGGLSQDLIDRMGSYEIHLRKAFLIFEQMNPPVSFKTSHDLYLQSIHYRLQSYECQVEVILAIAENDENKVRELHNKMDNINDSKTIATDRGWIEFKKAAGMK